MNRLARSLDSQRENSISAERERCQYSLLGPLNIEAQVVNKRRAIVCIQNLGKRLGSNALNSSQSTQATQARFPHSTRIVGIFGNNPARITGDNKVNASCMVIYAGLDAYAPPFDDSGELLEHDWVRLYTNARPFIVLLQNESVASREAVASAEFNEVTAAQAREDLLNDPSVLPFG
jgi:hypothetical protein